MFQINLLSLAGNYGKAEEEDGGETVGRRYGRLHWYGSA